MPETDELGLIYAQGRYTMQVEPKTVKFILELIGAICNAAAEVIQKKPLVLHSFLAPGTRGTYSASYLQMGVLL